MTDLELLSSLDEHMSAPTARGLASAVSDVVAGGQLVAGDRLPPIRMVAAQLGLSPTTVTAAWAMLQRAGVIASHGRGGTRIAPRQAGPTRYRSALTSGTAGAGGRARYTSDLSTGIPDPALLPSLTAVLRDIHPPAEPSSYLDEPVLSELLDVLRADWPGRADRITVVDGAMDALELIAVTHLRFGDRVAVEDPSFPPLLDLLEAVGVTPVPVPLDASGMRPERLQRAVASGIRAVVLQPRGHNPTGISMSAGRLAEVAEILSAADVLVIEDDSLGAISTSVDVSLGEQLPDNTLHVRSYSKSHGPDLRLAALGGPERLVDPIVNRRFLGQGWTSRLLQRVLAHLLTDEESIAAVANARDEYAHRRHAIASRLISRGIPITGTDGLNIWLPVDDETAALLLLASHGIGASPGRPFTIDPNAAPHVRITTGLVTADFDYVADVLAHAARAHGVTAAR